ncbi:hypothetical protein Mapa_005591 [Marchantia paleacea]|nr:hypothetical protein Mapa_005591 [Marchantia paleacea]
MELQCYIDRRLPTFEFDAKRCVLERQRIHNSATNEKVKCYPWEMESHFQCHMKYWIKRKRNPGHPLEDAQNSDSLFS